MQGLKHISQINMVVPPTEDNHVLRKMDIEIPLLLYNDTRDYKQGSMVVDLESRWFYYCVQDCPAGTILDDDNFFVPIPDDVAKERVNIYIENLTSQIDGIVFDFTTVMDISDKYFKVFYNGIYQLLAVDYEIVNPHTLRLLYPNAPDNGDILTIEYYTVSEKATEYGQIEIITEDLSTQIDESTGNKVFTFTAAKPDCINIFHNGLRLKQGQDDDYTVDRLNKQITMLDVDLLDTDKLLLQVYTAPNGVERRLVKQDMDLTPFVNGTADVFELGKQKVGDTYSLYLNGIKLTKDYDYFFDYGKNTIQTLGWVAKVGDALILEVYKMI